MGITELDGPVYFGMKALELVLSRPSGAGRFDARVEPPVLEGQSHLALYGIGDASHPAPAIFSRPYLLAL